MIFTLFILSVYSIATPQYQYAGCTQGGQWVRPFGDVSNDVQGALHCRDQCAEAGYEYFGLECPRSTVHCQCLSGNMGSFIEDHMCSEFNINSGSHCVGPFIAEETNSYYFLGAGSVSSVYHTQVVDLGAGSVIPVDMILEHEQKGAFVCGIEHLDEDCLCHGEVVYGLGDDIDRWTEPRSVDGHIFCNNNEFGDFFQGADKICICMGFGVEIPSDQEVPAMFAVWDPILLPVVTTEEPTQNAFICGLEHFSKDCHCNGDVVYGYGEDLTKWSEPMYVEEHVLCDNSVFGDPHQGQHKLCICFGTGEPIESDHVIPEGFGTVVHMTQTTDLTIESTDFFDATFDVAENLHCGWDEDVCGSTQESSVYIGEGGERFQFDASEDLHLCRAICAASTECAGFNYRASEQRCYFRRSTTCHTHVDSDRTCYTKVEAACDACPAGFWHYGSCALCYNGEDFCAISEFDVEEYGHLDIYECEFTTQFLMVGSTVVDDMTISDHIIIDYDFECSTAPILIPGPLSNNDDKTAHPRSQVSDDHAEIWLAEPSCSDGDHEAEHMDWLLLEDNVLFTDSTNMLQTGSLNIGADHHSTFTRVDFEVPFPNDNIVILAHVQSYEGPNYVKIRVKDVDATGFWFFMEEHEASDAWHVVERVGWVASTVGIYSYGGKTFEFGQTEQIVTHEDHEIYYDQIAETETTFFFGLAQTYEGGNPMSLRKKVWSAFGIMIYIQEDVCKDSEREHAMEVVGWLKVSPLGSRSPTQAPISSPSKSPSMMPTGAPSRTPSQGPSTTPSSIPSKTPSSTPSATPTSSTPSKLPSRSPSNLPSQSPTGNPSMSPTISMPTVSPSMSPTATCVTFEFECEGDSYFDGSYAKADSFRDVWMKEEMKLERVVMKDGMHWVIEAANGLLIADTIEDDFRLVESWSHIMEGETLAFSCVVECDDSHYPTQAPTFSSPSQSPTASPVTSIPSSAPSKSPSAAPVTSEPTMAPRYPIELEHHLSGVSEMQFEGISPIYIDALSLLFHVEHEDIEILDTEAIVNNKKRRLLQQAPELRVTCSVSFKRVADMEIYVDALQNADGRAAMNEWFAFLLTNHAETDGVTVAHMGIEGDFDLISYFTTTSPTFAPTFKPSEFPTSQPTEYVDNGSAVQIQEEAEGTALTLVFEGAMHDDASLHRAITDIINEEAHTVIDSTVVVYEVTEDGSMSITIDVDCDFSECALFYRNSTRIDHFEHRMKQDKGFSEFEILSFDVSKMDDDAMNMSTGSASANYAMFIMLAGLMVSLYMCYNYWKVCFCLKNSKDLEDDTLDLGEFVDEVLAVEARSEFFSTNSLSSVCESAWVGNEGCETIAVKQFGNGGAAYTETVDLEGFAVTKPISPVHMQDDVGESLYRKRQDTQECNVDVMVDSPRTRSTPFATKGYIGQLNNSESDSSITLYGSSSGEFRSEDDDTVLADYWKNASVTQF